MSYDDYDRLQEELEKVTAERDALRADHEHLRVQDEAVRNALRDVQRALFPKDGGLGTTPAEMVEEASNLHGYAESLRAERDKAWRAGYDRAIALGGQLVEAAGDALPGGARSQALLDILRHLADAEASLARAALRAEEPPP